jgi:hypothetical protein
MLRLLLLPALGASLVVMLVLRLCGREPGSPVAAALALATGIFAGNYFKESIEWQLDRDHPLDIHEVRTVLGWSLEGKPPASTTGDTQVELPMPPARWWLPWLAGLAILVELCVGLPFVPPSGGWALRALVAAFAGRLLTPADLRLSLPIASWLLSLAILLEWAVLVALARNWRDGTAATVSAICFGAAGMVVLHASSLRLADMALMFSAAMFGPALVAWIWRGNTAPALAGAAVFLPGLALTAQQETFSQVPQESFLLAGLAPLALIPLMLPWILRKPFWATRALALILPLVPAAWAIFLAAQAEPIDWENLSCLWTISPWAFAAN